MLAKVPSAILSATTTLVEPESEKKTRVSGSGVMRISSAASASAGSCVQPAKMSWSSLSVWARIAAMMRGCAWPWVVTHHDEKIGRAAWRERVCQYVLISVVAVSLKKKQQKAHIPHKIQNNKN